MIAAETTGGGGRSAAVLDALAPPRGGRGGEGAAELAALVRDTVAAGVERQVLLARLGTLRPRPRHLRLLQDALAPLRRSARLRVFDLPNGDLVAVAAPPAPQLAEAHATLAGMLEGAEEAAALLGLHRLPQEAAAVLAAVETALGLDAAVTTARTAMAPPPAAGRGESRPLDGTALAAAERALAAADITPFMRRQSACRLDPDTGGAAAAVAPQPVWEERRASLAALAEALLPPGTDAAAAPWLLRRLRRGLDRRLLADLSRPEELRDLRGPLLLPLSVASVTGPDFLRFDGLLPHALRGSVILAVTAEDTLADPAGFAFARDFARARGHRLALDEVAGAAAPGTLALLPADRAGFDLVRLCWSPALAALPAEAAARLRAALPAGPNRVVLAEVDRPAAIAWGWEMGIALFQGRLIERRRAPVAAAG